MNIHCSIGRFWQRAAYAEAQKPQVSSSLESGQYPCPGQNITFTCVTRRSKVLAWSSDEYIGTGGSQLHSKYVDQEGHVVYSSSVPSTFVTLVSKTRENGSLILKSQLHITVSSTPANITCEAVDVGTKDNIDFRALGMHC